MDGWKGGRGVTIQIIQGVKKWSAIKEKEGETGSGVVLKQDKKVETEIDWKRNERLRKVISMEEGDRKRGMKRRDRERGMKRRDRERGLNVFDSSYNVEKEGNRTCGYYNSATSINIEKEE